MKKGRVKLATLLLVSTALAGTAALAGCTKSKDDGATSASSSPGASVAATTEPPMEITVLGVNPPNDDKSFVQQYMEKKYNVKFKNMRVARDTWQQELNIKLAAKEVPDIWYLWSSTEVQQYHSQGLLAKIDRKAIEQAMPTYAKQITDMKAEDAWRPAFYDGSYYAVPRLWLDGATSYLTAYNKAWLTKLGFSAPPKDLTEFEQYLTKARNDDPDGNGKKDTYGYSATGKSAFATFNTIFAAFQVAPSVWGENDKGELQLGITTEKGRAALRQINKWYKAGLIDPEFITTDDTKLGKDVAGNKIGADENYWYYFDPIAGANQLAFKAANPGNELVVGKPLAGPYGPGTALSYGPFTAFVGMGAQVEKDPKKMQKILQMWNDLTADKETYKTTAFGKEGESFNLKDGVAVLTGDNIKQEVLGGTYGAGDYYNPFRGSVLAFQDFTYTKERIDFKNAATGGVPTMFSKKLFQTDADKKYPDLGKMVDEYLIKFVTGEIDLDKGYDDFIAKWNAAGGADITKAANDYYKANYKK